MQKIESKTINFELARLLQAARGEPLAVEIGGQPVGIVVTPKMYADMLHRGARRTVSHRPLTTDSNELFGLRDDLFCNDGP